MKLSKYIGVMQKAYDKYGDLECYYSIDEEGNGFKQADVCVDMYYADSLDYFLETKFSSKEEYIEYNDIEDDEDFNLIPIFIVN